MRFRSVDGMRGLAALIVVLGHIYEGAGWPNPDLFVPLMLFGNSGVDLFFVISGFCLFYPLTKPGLQPDWRDFFRRRARRLLPPYYAALAAVVALPIIIQPLMVAIGLNAPSVSWADWHQIWTHALFLQTLFHDTYYNLNGPLWSLAIEWQFYLAFPLAVWLLARLGWRAVVLIGISTLLYRMAVNTGALGAAQWNVDIIDLFPSRWVEFVLGMLVALYIRRTGRGSIPRGREVLDLAAIMGLYFLACYFLYGPLDQYPYPTKDLLNACLWCPVLLIACCNGTLVERVFSNRVLVWLGVRSYSIYLIHLPLVFALGYLIVPDKLGQPATFLALCGVGLPLTLACAAVFFEIFERPFLNAPREQIKAGELRSRQAAAPRGQEARITSPQAW